MIHLSIQDFQSIRSLDMDINGFTVLLGPTNVGKSAVMRAVQSALQNSGEDGYIRGGTQTARVSISDGTGTIVWERPRKGSVRYIIDGKVFDKLNRTVPDEISKMGYHPISVGDNDFEVQTTDQFAPLFILNKPGSALADILAKVTDLERVRLGARHAAVDLRSVKAREDAASLAYADAQQKLKRFAPLNSLSVILSGANNVMANLPEILESVEWMGRMLLSTQQAQKDAVKIAAGDVEVPEVSFGSDFEVYHQMGNWLNDLRDTANKAILSRVTSVMIPDTDAFDSVSRDLENFMELSRINLEYATALDIASTYAEVSRIVLPEADTLDDLFSKIKSYTEILPLDAERIDLEKRMECLKAEVTLPDMDDMDKVVDRYCALCDMDDRLRMESSAVFAVQTQLADLAPELDSVEREWNDVMKDYCPMCERPIGDMHNHG